MVCPPCESIPNVSSSSHGDSQHYVVVAMHSGKQTHSEGQSDHAVQFITPAGPRQSLLLTKDPNQFSENPKCMCPDPPPQIPCN